MKFFDKLFGKKDECSNNDSIVKKEDVICEKYIKCIKQETDSKNLIYKPHLIEEGLLIPMTYYDYDTACGGDYTFIKAYNLNLLIPNDVLEEVVHKFETKDERGE